MSIEVTPEWIAHMACCCPHCGLRTIVEGRCRACGGTKAHAGPYILTKPGDSPGKVRTVSDSGGDTPARISDSTAKHGVVESVAEGPLSVYDEPVEPPPVVVPITPAVGVERVLVAIEKRGKKRKGST